MRRFLAVVVAPACLASAALVLGGGCSGDDNGAADASIDALGVQPGLDAPAGEAASDGGGPPPTSLRLAQASPDLGPADFCWRAAGTTAFQGPVLVGPAPDAGASDAGVSAEGGQDAGPSADAADDAGDAGAWDGSDAHPPPDAAWDADASSAADAAGDAGDAADAPWDAGPIDADAAPGDAAAPTALVFGSMSPDLVLPTAGTFEIALVPFGVRSCSGTPVAGAVTLVPGKRTTVVILGVGAVDAGPAARTLVSFQDGAVDPQNARVRFIHAALGWPGDGSPPAPALAVSSGSTVLAGEIEPGKASAMSSAPPIDALGYTTLPSIADGAPLHLTAGADAARTTWSTDVLDLGATPGTVHTGLVVAQPKGELGVVWCGDSTTTGAPVPCKLYPAR